MLLGSWLHLLASCCPGLRQPLRGLGRWLRLLASDDSELRPTLVGLVPLALQEPSEQLSELWTRVVTIKGEVGSVRSASVGLSTLPLVLPPTMLVGLVAPLRARLGLAIGL